MSRLIIRGGRVVDPSQNLDGQADIALAEGRVAAIGRIDVGPDDNVIDAEGLIVTPGLIDPHVHLREPGEEDRETIKTGSEAAVNGGFTTVCCMPNTQPAIDDDSKVEFILRQAGRYGSCRVHPIGAATKQRKGEELAEMGLMAEAGAVAFTDDGGCVASPGMMRRVLTYVHMTGKCFMQHCQEPTLTAGSVMHAGANSMRLGLKGWPRVAEELIIERDIRLNRSFGCRYHAQHISSGGSVEIVARARAEGQPVTTEVSPHHLLLTDDLCRDYNTLAKVNPPLREQVDIDALIQGIKDGVITILATDHAPHSLESKQLEFAQAPFGIISLDCALPLYMKALIEPGHVDWPALIAMMTINPARLCDLDQQGLGSLVVSSAADVTLIDPDQRWTIRVDEFMSKSRNAPYDGWDVTGRAVGVIVGGEMKMLRDESRLRCKAATCS
ncbi:MAG: dihydroorotase [Phycisphaerales bacterium]|nr:dihydroorotase [Phycisphaerales bacterium]